MRLYTDNLVKKYGKRLVVGQLNDDSITYKGASISVEQGQIVGLLGPNGAGKTTTFYMIVGQVKPFSGKVFLQKDGSTNMDITNMPMYKRANNGIGYLPQEASVFRNLSVEDNIMAILEFQTNLTKSDRKAKLESLLNEFSLQKIRHNKGSHLSGGERRRTEIARALASNPKFILLDEPFAGVDPIAVQDIQSIVKSLVYRKEPIGVLITDHNVHETLTITDKAYILIEGNIFREGTPKVLAQDEQVRQLYLGDNFELR